LILMRTMTDRSGEGPWTVYILKCADGTLYTGIARDAERRLEEHRTGKGAKYLRGRKPLEMVFNQTVESRSRALYYEIKIKKLTRIQKQALVSNPSLFNNL